MNTHNQFTSSKERIHLLLVLFLSIIFCSCTKEDSPVSIEATSKVVTTRTSQDEYFGYAKLLQKSEMRKDIVIELSYKGFG